MNASFGIDHPLIAVNNIDQMRDRLISLGFNMTAIGKHPWGTSTSLAMFDGCLIEIMGVYDDNLLDENPAGMFRFGRHVHRFLQAREGIALTALHSTDSAGDARRAQAAGFAVAGHLEFGRDVILPDGRHDRTKTTLAMLPDQAFPRLSFFLCQQHRPELIYVPAWLEHPNSVYGICGISVWAEAAEQAALRPRLEAIYGTALDIIGGFAVTTANGPIQVRDLAAVENALIRLPDCVRDHPNPCIVGMEFRVGDLKCLRAWIKNSGLKWDEDNDVITLRDVGKFGNTVFQFRKPPNAKEPLIK